MKLAIADPPYFRRGERWYGNGNGDWSGNGTADVHPDAGIWDSPGAHVQLVQRLTEGYDGWAVALSPDSLRLYLDACPNDVHVGVWHRRNGMPGGNRVRRCWEPVIFRQPAERKGRKVVTMTTGDVLDAPAGRPGFAGAKPASWTRWVLDVLGYIPGIDTVDDLFPGSGAVSSAMDGMLSIPVGVVGQEGEQR